jgi:hypothetical protein
VEQVSVFQLPTMSLLVFHLTYCTTFSLDIIDDFITAVPFTRSFMQAATFAMVFTADIAKPTSCAIRILNDHGINGLLPFVERPSVEGSPESSAEQEQASSSAVVRAASLCWTMMESTLSHLPMVMADPFLQFLRLNWVVL